MTDDNTARSRQSDGPLATLQRLVANGYHPIPVVPAGQEYVAGEKRLPGGKTPGRLTGTRWQPLAGWQDFADTAPSAAKLRAWAKWFDRDCGEPNIGLVLGGPHNLVALDLDIPNEALATEAAWLADAMLPAGPERIGNRPKTLRLFRCSEPATKRLTPVFHLSGTDNRAELLGAGQQFVAFGTHPNTGRAYEWPEADPLSVAASDLPEVSVDQILAFMRAWNEAAAKAGAERKGAERAAEQREGPKSADELTANADRVLEALEWIDEDHADDRDIWVRVGHALKSATRGFEDQEAVRDAWHQFSAKSGKYDADDAETRWDSFPSDATDIGSGTVFHYARECGWDDRPDPADEFPPISQADRANDNRSPVERAIDEVNAEYSIALVGGKALILRDRTDNRGQPTTPDFLTVQDFKHFRANHRIFDPTAGKNGRERAVADIWMESRRRREYQGVTFAPAGADPKLYNLWTGWAVAPDPSATCQRFLDHLRDNVARGDETIYRWVVGWFAHMVQRPATKPGTALVLRGTQGTGKSIVGEVVGRLFPPHHTKVSSPRHVTGNFNSHLAMTLLLQAEEAFWAGGKETASTLKDMVTGSTMQIERKGVDAFQVPSVMRLLITSNEEWVVPAAAEERRFAVLDVSNARAQDTEYFRAMLDELERGGYGALLDHLQRFDLSTVDVTRIPKTEGLLDQKMQSLDSVTQFWFECLRDGDVPGAHDFEGGWPDEVPRRGVFEAYRARVKDRRYHTNRGEDEARFGKQLRTLSPDIKDVKRRRDGNQVRLYVLPPLDDCRAQFEAWIGHSVQWEDGEDA